MEGVKRKRRCEMECKDHIFAVQTLKGNSSKYDIKLQFCPKYQREPLPPEHTYPEYNDDGKFYTSAFILGVDRRVLIKNEQQELMDHQKQIRDSLEKHNQLVFPRPNSKHSLCSVCKEHYKNYYFHIATPQHREKIGLSLYNNHIKELCSIYIHLWQGAEERADAEAELRAQQEQKRRQEMAELVVQEQEEQDDDELLDVQRGSRDVQEQQEFEQQQANYTAKPLKKHSKSVFKDDDTIPFTAKTSKRVAPEGRTYTSDYLRKKFQYNAINHQEHAHRQREQRRYQRERDKLKTERDNPERNKEFIKMTEKEGDVFTIMKAAFAINNALSEPLTQKQPQQKVFVWKSTTSRFRIKETVNQKPESALDKFEKENRKYQIDNGDKFTSNNEGQPHRPYYHCYYPIPPFMPDFKANINDEQSGQIKKGAPYPHPYMYPPPPSFQDPHFRPNRNFEKENGSERALDRVPAPYWAYPPYFMPSPIEANEHTANSSYKQPPINGSNTNINMNFPTHLYPPNGNNRYPPYPEHHYGQSSREAKEKAQVNHQSGQLTNGHNSALKAYPYPPYRHHEKFHHQNAPLHNLS